MSGIRAARNLLRSIPRNSKATSVSLQHHNIMLASVIARSFSSSPDKLEYSAVPKSDFGKLFVYIMLNDVSYMLIAQLFCSDMTQGSIRNILSSLQIDRLIR